MARKKTGLGADGLFGDTEKQTKKKTEKPKETRQRTNVVIKSSTIILMRRMQEQALLEGERLTYSGLIDEAIEMLAKDRGIDV